MTEQEIKEVFSLLDRYNPYVIAKYTNQLTEILNRFEKVKEDEEHHKGETTLTHLISVMKNMDTILSFLKQERKEYSSYVDPLHQFLLQFPKLDDSLEKEGKIGKHTREELLFFATVFHDIGKIYYFRGLEKRFSKSKKFGRHSFIGKWLFSNKDEKKLLEEEIQKNLKTVMKLVEKRASWKEKDSQEYAERRQLIVILKDIHSFFDTYQKMFEELELSNHEITFIKNLIEHHMVWFDIIKRYEALIKKFDEKENKELQKAIEEGIKKTKDNFYESLLLSMSDNAGTAGQGLTRDLLKFFNMVIKIKENPDIEYNLVTGEGLKKAEKAKPKYNFSNLFKNYAKDEALKIKKLIENADKPEEVLKKAGYDKDAIERIMIVITP